MSEPKLDYVVDTIPAPLQTEKTGQIRILVSNPHPDSPVKVKDIAITFPVDASADNPQAADLTGDFGAINPSFVVNNVTNTTMWDVTPIPPQQQQPPLNSLQGTFLFASSSKDGNSIAGEGWVFLLPGIPVNSITGPVEITIVETTDASVTVMPKPTVTKDNTAHYISKLFLYVTGHHTKTPVSSVPPGTCVSMYWKATDNANYCVGFVPFSQISASDDIETLTTIPINNCTPVSGKAKDGMLTGTVDLGTNSVPGLYVLTGTPTTAGGKNPSFRGAVPLWMDAPDIATFKIQPNAVFSGQQTELSFNVSNVWCPGGGNPTAIQLNYHDTNGWQPFMTFEPNTGAWSASVDQQLIAPPSDATGLQLVTGGPGGTKTEEISIQILPTLAWNQRRGQNNQQLSFPFDFDVDQYLVAVSGFQVSYDQSSGQGHNLEEITIRIENQSIYQKHTVRASILQQLQNETPASHQLSNTDSWVELTTFAAPANANLWMQAFAVGITPPGTGSVLCKGPGKLTINGFHQAVIDWSIWATNLDGYPIDSLWTTVSNSQTKNSPPQEAVQMNANISSGKNSNWNYQGSVGVLGTSNTGNGSGFDVKEITLQNGTIPDNTTLSFGQDVDDCILILKCFNSGGDGDHHNFLSVTADLSGVNQAVSGKTVTLSGNVSVYWQNANSVKDKNPGSVDVLCVATLKTST